MMYWKRVFTKKRAAVKIFLFLPCKERISEVHGQEYLQHQRNGLGALEKSDRTKRPFPLMQIQNQILFGNVLNDLDKRKQSVYTIFVN
ncbi:MAG: hypothetical protein IIY71_04500 [Oscillospiraceae bacterium]|nr:hypothetical protein [Oscillospiraceae bacterium]